MSNSFIMTESIVRPAKMPYGRLKDNGFVGIEGEHAARALVVETKDDLSAFASVNLIIDDLDCGAMTKTTSGNTTTLSMALTSSMIGRSGRKICQLIMVNSGNTVVQKSSQFEAYVGRANEIERSVDDGVTIIILTEAVTEMAREAAAAAAEEAVADVVEDCQAIADAASASADAAAQSASDAQTAAASITVDATLDPTSTHAIQNKAVASEISSIKADLDNSEGYLYSTIADIPSGKMQVPRYNIGKGFIGGDGYINTNVTNKEVYTSKIEVHESETIHINIKWSETNQQWVAVARYDAEESFIVRQTVCNLVSTDNFDLDYAIPQGTGYIAVTYRTYTGSSMSISRDAQINGEVLSDKSINIDKFSTALIKQTRNIFTEKWEHSIYSKTGVYSSTTSMLYTACPPNIPVVGGETYTVSWGEIAYHYGSRFMYVHQFNDNGERVKSNSFPVGPGFVTLTLEQSTSHIGLMVYINGDVESFPAEWTELVPEWTQVEAGAVKTAFVPPYAFEPSLIDNELVYSGIKPLLKENVSVNTISRTVKTIAHRGDDVLAPQCTAPAYIIARKNGIFITENDLWLSEDGEFVMWHDITLARLGNLVDINGYLMYTDGTNYYYVNDSVVYTWDGTDYVESSVPLSSLTRCAGADYGVNSTYASIGLPLSVLKRIDFGVYKGSQFAGTQILTLEEWVMLCKQLGMEIYIDKKLNYTDALLTEAANIVKKCGMGNYASWLGVSDVGQIDLLRTIIPDARVGVLTHPNPTNIVTYADKNIGRGFFFNGDAKNGMTAEAIQLGLNAGFDVEVWYVDFGNATENQILGVLRDAISCGVTAITTDHYRADDAYSYLLEEY